MKTTNPIRQAITTRYLAPTNTKGSRVKASCERGSITLSWDHGDHDDNHRNAMRALLCKFYAEDQAKYGSDSTGWGVDTEWHGGAIDGAVAWVHVPAAKEESAS